MKPRLASVLVVLSGLLLPAIGHSVLQGVPGQTEAQIARNTVAILLEDQRHRGPDGRPGFYPTTGVLIANGWVLTVRHGFARFAGRRYTWKLHFGPDGDASDPAAIDIKPSDVIVHPELDLALVHLKHWQPPFGFQPLRILSGNEIAGDSPARAFLAGFGESRITPGKTLLYIVEEPISAIDAGTLPRLPEQLFPPQLAGHYLELDQRDGKGSCSGDSGGPVLLRHRDEFALLGIIAGNASYAGHHPCLDYSYAVRADHAVQWISSVTGLRFNPFSSRFEE